MRVGGVVSASFPFVFRPWGESNAFSHPGDNGRSIEDDEDDEDEEEDDAEEGFERVDLGYEEEEDDEEDEDADVGGKMGGDKETDSDSEGESVDVKVLDLAFVEKHGSVLTPR
jgi:hypothetical protein